ncbi:uncharacterized protein LOC123988607 [Osmia bicornis bicornis]|uniref:uncharacterized protein LOC123988607 n=1 Tax=Osmia bicornis bicornis TaxID=1437191 RepID=UPI001EAEC744|nr:uncharacterized protein LOC123988607 [Osmia bicornis bicornis]
MGKIVHSGQRQIIVNLHKDLKRIGSSTIQRTLSQYKATGTVTSPCKKKVRLSTLEKMTMDQKALLRLKVHQFWERKELPTIKSLLAAVNADGSFPKFSHITLYRILKSLNFRYTDRVKNCAVLEQPYILNWREQYIRAICQYREEERPIYYLDETWVNTGDCQNKVWRDFNVVSVQDARRQGLSTGAPAPTGRGKRLIVLHIGSADGFLPGGLLCFESKTNTADYHDEMNGGTFFEWFCRIEPLLKENAVVKQLLTEKIEGVTSEMWKNCIHHTIGIEQKLMDMDRFSQDTLEMPTIGSDVDMSDTDVSD